MKQRLRITDVKAYEVAIPVLGCLRSGGGADYGGMVVRTIVEVFTDAGVVGLGEGGQKRMIEEWAKPLVIGEDPFHHRHIRKVLGFAPYMPDPYRPGHYETNALEIACLDIVGQALERPLYELLGGGVHRKDIPYSAYCFFRYPNANGEHEVNLDNYVEECLELMRRHGFRTLKLKLGVFDADAEIRIVREVRRAVGDEINIRIDANGAWTLPTALRVAKALEECDLEFIEGPVAGGYPASLYNYARLRSSTQTPIAVDDMYYKRDLVDIIRYEAADVVLADVFHGDGVLETQSFLAMARALGLGLCMHSGYGLGVGEAVRLHVAAATPEMVLAIDGHYHQFVDDILEGGKLPYQDGCIRVPEGPGLGVKVDREKMERYAFTEERKETHRVFYAENMKRYGLPLTGWNVW